MVRWMSSALIAIALAFCPAAAEQIGASFQVRLVIVPTCTVVSSETGHVDSACRHQGTAPIVRPPRAPTPIEREVEGLTDRVRVIEVLF